jgi:predicted nucleic acid-binding protein
VIVLDASAAVEIVLTTPLGDRVSRRIAYESVQVPELMTVEVIHALRRLLREGALTAFRARAALRDLIDLDAERYGHDGLLSRALALRDNFTAYDAVYVALAESLGCPLLTCDGRLARSPGHRARIELFE